MKADHGPRLRSLDPADRVVIVVNGVEIETCRGESVHAALTAAGIKRLKASRTGREGRGAFCGMGVCYECQVTIDGSSGRRACQTEVRDRMVIEIHED